MPTRSGFFPHAPGSLFILFLALLLLPDALVTTPCLQAQSSRGLLGYGGMIIVPTATLARDATVAAGFSRIPAMYGYKLYPAPKSIYYAALTFTPFFEASFALVKPDQLPDRPLHVGDRTATVKLRLWPESRRRPALAIGSHDFFNLKWLGLVKPGRKLPENFAALYAVATKSFKPSFFHQLVIHLGYGTDWLPAVQNYLKGPFGGVELFLRKEVAVMAESDARWVNVGARLRLWSHLQGYVNWMDGRELCGGVGLSVALGEL